MGPGKPAGAQRSVWVRRSRYDDPMRMIYVTRT